METKELTILEAVEKVHQISRDSMLILERHDTVKTEIKLISDYFQINKIQSIFLASFASLSCFEKIELKELIDYLKVEKINLLPYINDIQYLVDKNILNKDSDSRILREDYSLNRSLLEFIVSNKKIPVELISIIPKEHTFHEFLKTLDELSNAKDDERIDYGFFVYKLKKILEDNRKFKLVNYACENLDPIDSFVFFDSIIDAIAKCSNNFNTSLQSTVDDFTRNQRETFDYVSNFLLGKTKLNALNLVEKDNNEFGERHRLRLTDNAVKMLRDMEGISFVSKE